MRNLRIGLVGCGHIAGAHVRAWKKVGLGNVVGVFDVNVEGAKRFANRHRIQKVYDRLSALVDDVDVVDDCSPPSAHLGVAMEALGRARHYLVEKPMVLSSADLEMVLEAQRSSGAQVCVVHTQKYNRGVKAAWKWVQEGRIGRLLSLERLLLTDPATDRMLKAPSHWSHGLPGGRWMETLPHELYLTYQFLGELQVSHVTSLRLARSDFPHTPDEMVVELKNEDSIAVFRYSARCRSNVRSLILYGSEGTIRVEILGQTAVLARPHTSKWMRVIGLDTMDALTTLWRILPDRPGRISALVRNETLHTGLIRDFARYLTGQGPAPVSLDEIRYVVQTAEEVGLRLQEAWVLGEASGAHTRAQTI